MSQPRVAFYTRKGCHLCDVALATVERVRARVPFDLAVIDVDGDRDLAARYGGEVPVILVDGRRHAKYRVDEAAFARHLTSAGSDDPVGA